MLITLEGIDGCGKTTQAERLSESLGPEALLLREPGGTEAGERLRDLLKDPDLELDPRAELLMFCTARAQLVEQVIRPALTQGRTVICDRYTDSTLAYQGGARGLDESMIRTLNRIATGDLVPDLTFWLEIDPARAAERIGSSEQPDRGSGDRFEDEGLDFQRRIAAAYESMAAAEPGRFHRIDADREADVVASEMLAIAKGQRGG